MHDEEVNSAAWWERYFAESWDAHGGRDQTRHFMKRVVESLPTDILHVLQHTPDVRILDWGCAFGDGVHVLANAFPRAIVSGLDFASRAIDEARSAYPQYDFVHSPQGSIPSDYDAVFCSNCLEHFDDPLAVLKSQIVHAKSIYVCMVPYDEFPLHPQHKSHFREDSFPERIGPFERATARPIDVEAIYWPGKQLLVVYTAVPPPAYRQFVDHVVNELAAARRQLTAANNAVMQLRDGLRRYSSAFTRELAEYRNQRAWQVMLLIRKLYSHAFQEGWGGRWTLAKFLTALPFRGIPPLGEYDVKFSRVETYVSDVSYLGGDDNQLSAPQMTDPPDPNRADV